MQGKAMLEAASHLQGELIAAQTELSGLQQIYGPENSRVLSARARVGELQSRLKKFSGVAGATGGAPEGGSDPYPSLEQLPILGNTYYGYYRKAKIDETLYEILMKQYELAKVQEAKEIPSIKMLDEPSVPERKVWPPRLAIIALCTMLAFLVAIAYCAFGRYLERLPDQDPRRELLRRLGWISEDVPFRVRRAVRS
jgi:uncharacterized protein involved in exopolysaccharide biosynthesis